MSDLLCTLYLEVNTRGRSFNTFSSLVTVRVNDNDKDSAPDPSYLGELADLGHCVDRLQSLQKVFHIPGLAPWPWSLSQCSRSSCAPRTSELAPGFSSLLELGQSTPGYPVVTALFLLLPPVIIRGHEGPSPQLRTELLVSVDELDPAVATALLDTCSLTYPILAALLLSPPWMRPVICD